MLPFYNPRLSYEDNYKDGPFGVFARPGKVVRKGKPKYTFLSHKLYSPFGIPAGPLPTSAFVSAAFQHGFDLCTYKTVRTGIHAVHALPNILAVKIEGDLTLERAKTPLKADATFQQPLSITNSFGVPSRDPDVWQLDMQKAVASAGKGQLMIGSFQGTKDESGSAEKFIDDYVLGARLVKETGAKVLEANISCPNEGTAELLCFDTSRVQRIVEKIKQEIGDTPLILKLGYFASDMALEKLVRAVAGKVEGLAVINTIPAPIVDEQGDQALPGEGRLVSGVCGVGIRWAGLEMVGRLANIKEKYGYAFEILGVGGASSPADVRQYLQAGASVAQSATGAMWNPKLGQQVYADLSHTNVL